MRAVVQRVSQASVTVGGELISEIGPGLLILLGVDVNDTQKDADYLLEKIVNLRIFTDNEGRMNLSLLDIGAAIMVISQFTLLGDARKGRRPSYIDAARPQDAQALYEYFLAGAGASVQTVGRGVFGADMKVGLVNDGPVTILLDSSRLF